MSEFSFRPRYSLFLKILLVFIAASLSIVLSFWLIHDVFEDDPINSGAQRLGVNYGTYVVDAIGVPPDTLQARQIAENQHLQIRIQAPTFSWVSHPNTPHFEDAELAVYEGHAANRAGPMRNDSALGVDMQRGSTRYLVVFAPSEWALDTIQPIQSILSLFFVLLVVVVLYVIMRWLLKPIRTLHEGVQHVSQGQFDIDLRTEREDELGALVQSFNEMARRVKHRIQARDQLLLDVSHELRSPLTRIKVALELIPAGAAKESIADDVNDTESMIAEILETERLASPHGGLRRQRVDLAHLVQNTVMPFSDQQPGVQLAEAPEELWLNLDPDRIRMVLGNLVTNAIKYSAEDDNPVEISIQVMEEEICVVVQDFGCGIPDQDLPHLFEPFYRVDKARTRKSGGYGLGLSLAKKIMDAHGGRIEVSSTLDVGTKMALYFKR